MSLADYEYVKKLYKASEKNAQNCTRNFNENEVCRQCGYYAMLGIKSPVNDQPECIAKQVLYTLSNQGYDCALGYPQMDDSFVIQLSPELYNRRGWYIIYNRDSKDNRLFLIEATFQAPESEPMVFEETPIYDFFVNEGILP